MLYMNVFMYAQCPDLVFECGIGARQQLRKGLESTGEHGFEAAVALLPAKSMAARL
jgi:hypothetical protein